ncbi:hypothetical protein M513_11695 [Trichuris suis]|uniref:protein-tyrosine-phosphatase n=1 Tax=Trichuris suis TaxID=68888 RepID=A0A085LR30_9BILA|nr:hypothetical protein M513_11695 [Trichuris suis]
MVEKMDEAHRKELYPRYWRPLVLLVLLLCVSIGATPRRSLKRRGNSQSDLGSACRRNIKKFALFKECEPVYPTNLSGTCVKSALSPREICYPDFYQLDYTCAARYGVNQRSVSPPTIANGQYKSLITKFRAGDGRPSQLKAYLVVQYQCNAGFEFVDEVEHLYCQKGKWIATPPMCIPSHLIEEYRTPGNPCLIDHAGCSHYCRFISPASARCECSDGYLLNSDGKTCVVELKNPCDLDNGGCSHFCVDEGQGRAHRCRCPPDHTLASDGRTCEPAKRRTGDSAGFCKDLSYGYPDNSCKDECHMDEDCPVGSRCCWNGCSQVCFQPVDGDLPTCDDAMGCECSVLNVTHHQCRCSKKLCLMPTVAPVVSISPGRRLQLQPESSINVTCIAEGFPTPAIMWYWDSFPITDSKDVISPEPSKLVLQLKNISTSITLRCEAVNNLGMASSQLEIMVIGNGNGKYELNYVDTEAVGEKPSRKWVILETSEPKADLTLLPSTTYYVKIRAFNKFGPGPFTPIFYVVTESEGNNEAKDNACCALTQRLQEFPPKVKIRPDNQVHVPRGGRVELECAAVGNPAPTVAWYKDGKLLEEPDDSNPTITLLQLEDVIQSTTYECQAENKLGKTNVSVSIIVLGPGSPPQKIQYHLVDGVNVEIEWEPPTISNGEILGYTIHYTDSPSEDIGNWEFLFSGVSPSIEVLDLKPHTSYTFGIRALNAFGPGPLSARFVVNTTQPSAEPKVAVFPSELVMLPPGGSMNVSCSSTGYPVPLLRWLEKENEVKSFAELPAGEGVEASRVLVIEQIYETTTFTCEAENSEGVDSRDVHVRITGIMTAESFSIKQFHSGPGNAPKNVKVEAVGADVTIRWQPPTITNGEIKDYVVYIAEDPEQLEEKWIEYHTDCPNTEMKLTLEPNKLYAARIAACTEYGCGVKSEPFEVRTLHVGSSPIVVIEPDEEVRQVKPGSSHHITCTASAYPPPLLTWYKNNVKIKSWQMPPVGGGQPEPLSFVLTIGHVAETLLLECEAVNEIGTAKRSITLEVLGPGSPPENISYVVVGDSVEIRWDEPVHKNGPIEMYNLSYIANDDLPNGTWTSVSISGDDEKFVLLNLEEDTAYQIKLAAVGPGGSGPFSEPLLLRTSRAEVKPSVSIDPPTLKYQLHWGERLKVLCSASGNPQPLATWYLLGERVSDIGPEVTLDEEIYESSEYECTALNKLGTASTKISVTVKDDHQLPADVTAEVKGTSVELKWEKPESDSVVSFIIYYSNHSDGHENVFHLVVPVEDPKRVRYSVVLDNLRPASNYSIRLQAVFDMGPGPMSEDMKITTGDKAWYIGCNVEPKSPLDVPYGAGISVRCIGKGEPTPHIVVRRNGNKVEGPIKNPFELRLDDIHEPVFIECLAQNEVGRAKDSLSLFPTNELTSQTRPTLEITEDGVQISWPHLSSLAVPGMTYEAYISEDEDAPLDSWSKLPVNPEAWSALLDNLPTGRRLFARLKMYPFAKNSVLWTPKSELTLPQPLKDVSLKLVNGRFKLHIGDFVFPDDMVINVAITDNVSKPLDQWLSFPLTKDPNDGSAVSSIDVESGRKYYLRVVAIKGGNRKLLSLIHNITTPALDLCQQSQCEHTCKVVRGSHSSPENVVCQCFSGYELASDGRSCVPIMSASTWLHKNKSHRRFCSVPTTNSYCPGTGTVWYYNPATSRCVTLNQSGCEGSVYEFQSWLDCMDACSSQRCHRLRRQHFIRKTSKAFLPECDDNGDFDPLQCHQSAGQCWCVDVKTGQEIPGTKRNIVDGTPECKGCNYQLSQVLSSYQHKLTTVQFLPKCTADGLYERVQCADDSDDCWCVDEVSGEEIDGTRSTIRPLSCELKAKVKPENVQVKIQNSSLYLNVDFLPIDLCQQSQCEHTCKVVRGSHSSPENVVCQCFSGYELASDGRSCVPIMSASTWLHKNKSHRRFCSVPTTNSYCPGTGTVWYYNPATSRCVTLNQSGCEGSVYEFQSWLDCMDACSSQRCHRLRRQHFIRKTSKAFLPECDDNGDFDPLQCHQSAGQCWCVDVKTGQEIPGTKRNIVDGTPECKGCNYQLSQVLSSYQHKLTTVQFLPKCTADGLYERVQCADDSDDCWCVDEVSGEEIDGTRSTIRPLSCELKAKVKPENVQVKIQNSSLYLKWEMPNNVSAKCHQSAGQCWCVDVKTGQEIPGTKRNIVDGTPECKGCNYQLSQVLSSYQHKLTTVQFLPKCTADGLYERVQCADDSDDCWCVDEVSGEEIDGTRSTIRPLSCELKAKVKPENVQVKIQNSSLYLKWEMPNNVSAKKYYVYFTQKPEEPINKWYVVVVYSPQDKKEIKLMNVALPEAKYAIKVKPVLDNESGVASEVTFAEPTGGQLSKPVNFRVDKVTPDSATLAWDRPDDWEGRNVKVSFHVTNLNTGEEMETKPMNDEKRQFLALEPGTSYLVSMVVLGNNGQSSFSEPIAVRTDEVAIAPIHSTTSSPRSEVVVELSTLPSVQIPDMPEIIEYSEPQDYHLLWRTTAQPVISSSRLLKPEDATVGSQKKESHSLIPTYDVGDGKISSAKDGMTLSMPEVAGKQYPLPGHTDKQLLPAGRIPDSEPQPGRRYPLPGHSVDQLLPPGRVPEVERQPERAYPLPGHSNEQLLPTGRIPEAERQPERRYPLPGHSNEQLLPAGRIPDTDRQPERRYPSPGHSIDQLLPPGRISEVERQSGSAYPFPGHSNEQLLPAGRIPDADQQPEGGYPLPGHSIDQLLPPGRISEVERQSGSAYPLPGHSNEQLLPAGQIPNAERQPKRPHPLPGHSNEQMLPTGRKPNAERQSERQLPLPGHSSEQLLPAGRTSVSERPPERQFPLPGYSNEQLLAPGRIPEAERHSGRQFPLPDLSSNQFVPAGRITNAERQHPMARHSNELSLPADRIPDATVGVPGSRYEVYTRSPITEKVYVPPIVEERPFFPSLKTSDLDTPVEYTTSTTDPLYRSTISSRDRKDGEIGHRDPPGPVQFRLSKKPGRTGFYVFWKQQKGANVPKEYILYVAEGRHSSLPATATKTVVPASVHGYSVDATRPIRYTVWMQARNRFGVGPLSKPKLWFPSKPVSTHSPVPNWAPILVSADPIAPEAVALKWIVPRGRTMPDADLTALYSDNPKTPMDQWPSQVIPKGAKDHGLLRVPHTARPYKICLQFDAPLGKGRPSNCLTTKPFQGTYDNNDVFPIVASMPIISTKEKGVSAKDRAALIRGSINKGEKRKKWVPRLLSAEPLSSDHVVVRWQPPSNHEAIDSDILIHYGNDEGRRIDTWPYVMARSKESGQEIVKVLPSDQPYTFCARLRDSDGVGQTSNCIRARLEPTTSVTSTTVTTPIRPDDRRAYMKSLSPPMAPTITSVSKTGPSSLTVTWDTPNDRSLEDNDIMIYYTDDPSKPIAYWQSTASAEERRSKTFKISNKDKTYTVCARSRNQYGLGELSNCVTSEGLPGAVANQSSRQSISGQQISNENGQPLGTSVDARSSKSNPSDYGESLPRSQATIYTYNPWLYTAAPGRLYNVNSGTDRMTPVAARKAKEKGSREIPVKDSTWPSEKLPRILSSKSTLSNKEIGKQPLPPSLYDEDEPYSPVIKSSVGHRPRDIVDREDNERYVKTEGEPYSSRGISEQRPGDRIDEEVERERMDRNEPYLPIGTVEEQPSNAIHGQVKPYAEDRRQPFASKHFKKSKRPIDNMVREKADDNRRKPAKSKPRSSVARGNVERQRPHGKAERYTIDKSQPSSATSKTAGSEPYANIQAAGNEPMRKPLGYQPEEDGMSDYKTESYTTTSPSTNCDFAQFTKSIPDDSVTTASACNCTCGAPTAYSKKIVCFYEDALEVRDNLPFGRLSQFTQSAVQVTPVPPGAEQSCNCLRPQQGEQCPDGYLMKSNGICYDIDECAYRNGGCSQGCVNTAGSFYCACPYGMVRDPENPFQCATTDSFLAKLSKLFTVYVWDKIRGNALSLESLIGTKENDAAKT